MEPSVDDELARCKDLASRAREMAKHALNERTRATLLSIAEDHERIVAAIEAERRAETDQAG